MSGAARGIPLVSEIWRQAPISVVLTVVGLALFAFVAWLELRGAGRWRKMSKP